MKKPLLMAALFGMLAAVSCKKTATPDVGTTPVSSINDIKVPSGFTWESSRSLNVSVNVSDTRFDTPTQKATYSISLYNGNPFTGGTLLSTGSATAGTAFSAKIYMPTQATDLYVVKTAPDNSKLVQKVTAGTADISLTMGAIDQSLVVSSTNGATQQVNGAAPTSPDCNSGCGITITTNTNNVNVNSGDVYCITGSNITVGFSNVNGGIIRVCGSNVTLQNLNFNGAATLIVTTSGSANISSLNFNSSAAAIQNFGTINFSNSFPDNGIFSNYGIFNNSGDFNLNSNAGIFTNSGTMHISGSFNNGTTAVATNNGTMTVAGNFQPNSNSAFVNNCSLIVSGNFTQSASVKNYSFINVTGTTTINSNAELGMYNGAELKTRDFIVDGSAVGYGTTSLIKITGSTNIRNQGSVVSNIQVYAVNNTIDNTSGGKITSGATQGSSVYIPVSGCNSDGNGTPAIADADGDGVADNLDAYPNDPTKAYNVAGGTGTVAFEDQWPQKADFDLNDLVMAYDYRIVTNAKNIVVQVNASYSLLATGGTFGNAFAVEFPVSATNVSGLVVAGINGTTSTSFEAGQANAVVTLFTNMRNEVGTWNTKPGDILSPTRAYSVTFNVANGPAIATFGQDGYNPFIYNTTRGHEIHLAGKTPTTLVDTKLFATADDNTSVAAGRYYVTKTGLPYAISVPVIPFNYPTEGTDITKAFLHFSDWAVAGGTKYTDWYSNTALDYRNVANIFTK